MCHKSAPVRICWGIIVVVIDERLRYQFRWFFGDIRVICLVSAAFLRAASATEDDVFYGRPDRRSMMSKNGNARLLFFIRLVKVVYEHSAYS